jgi:hypothetical protein
MPIGNAYVYRMPVGFAGVVTRASQATLQPEILDPTLGPVEYGTFVKMVSGKICKLAAADVATAIVGLIAKPYPAQDSGNPGLGDNSAPNLALPGDILKRGYMTVKFAGVTAAKGGLVYVVNSTAGGKAIGDIVENATNSVAVANCVFMGAADGGMVEISYNIER